MRSPVRWSLFVAAVLSVASTASAESPGQGEAHFRRYCGACHGLSAKGDGIVSGLMRPAPPDLTRLAKRAGGDFPFLDVMKAIDGRSAVGAHGDSEMPVWGEILSFEAAASPDAVAGEVQGKLLEITEYLRSVQEK